MPDVRVLGIDPGTRVLGFGVIEQRGNELRAVTHGTVNPRPSLSLAERLDLLFTGINSVLESARPDAVAVEGVFSHRNAHSALIPGTPGASRCSAPRAWACRSSSTHLLR